ncbi:MAG: GldG family protein [Candidatus Latescibacteria bacterium]|nr:GldG family protein [Candidatus Latescibacterota bacterium]
MQGKRTNITIVTLSKFYQHGLSPLIIIGTFLIGLIIINYVVSVKTLSYDVTENKKNTLCDETRNMLEDINFDVNVKAFYPVEYQSTIKSLFDKYVRINNHLKIEYVDPIKNPVIAETYEVSRPRTIVFANAMSKSRLEPPPPGGEHKERDITIALYRLITQETKTVYFTTGHAELSISNTKPDGLFIANKRLTEQNYIVKEVNLLEEGKVPDDCSILIVAGPSVPFTDEEGIIMWDFLERGGNAFLMVDPGADSNLNKLLLQYGLIFGDNYIYETSRNMTTQMGGPIAPFCTAQDISEITEKLPNQNFLFRYVRSVDITARKGDIKVTKLLASSENSWAETDIESAKYANTNQKPSRDENEKKGPITMAVVTERDFMLPDSLIVDEKETYSTRSAFFGNASFISNIIVSPMPSNMNLFLNTVNWITKNEKIMEITPHLDIFTPIELRETQRRLLTWLTVFVFPFSIFLVGIIVVYRRR